jgi:hypothetical protein
MAKIAGPRPGGAPRLDFTAGPVTPPAAAPVAIPTPAESPAATPTFA